MKILLLPGVNPATIEWMNRLIAKLPLAGSDTTLNEYLFWAENESDRSIAREVANLSPGTFDLVIAKSLGTLICLQALAENYNRFKRALLIGIPWQIIDQTDFAVAALSGLDNRNVFVVQQAGDKLGPADGLKKAYAPVNLTIIAGDDHLYESFELYIDQVSRWLTPDGNH